MFANAHAKPANAQAMPANAHAMPTNAHIMPTNVHAMPQNDHAMLANAHAMPERNRYSFFFSTILVLLVIMTKAKARNPKMIGKLGVTCRQSQLSTHEV